jgi:hypothetical protein
MHNNKVEWEYGNNDNIIVFSCNNILLFVAQRIGTYQFKVLNVLDPDDIKFIRNHAPDYKTKTDPTKAILSDFVKGKVNRFEWDIKKNPKRKTERYYVPKIPKAYIRTTIKDWSGFPVEVYIFKIGKDKYEIKPRNGIELSSLSFSMDELRRVFKMDGIKKL